MAATLATAGSTLLTREQSIQEFLRYAGWEQAEREPIPGDASFRRYERLRRDGESAILMDAPPERENSRLFVNAQRYLAHAGGSVPAILCERADDGLLLLQDFGDNSVSSALRTNPAEERDIYRDAVSLLALIARDGLSKLEDSGSAFAPYDAALLANEIEVCAQWFLPEVLPVGQAMKGVDDFRGLWKDLLDRAELTPQVVTHRDYHADNLFLLPGQMGPARIGMLDFQDAVLGRPAYDLVSLLEDARRDVSPATVREGLETFIRESGAERGQLLKEYAFYGAQRNAKILGIFTRLYRRDGKPRYLGMIPRVWNYFEQNLQHPDMAPLKAWRDEYVTEMAKERILNLQKALTGFS